MTRADKKRNTDKVAAEMAKSPLASEREIAESTGISKSAVNRAKSEVGQSGAKDSRIISLTDADFRLVWKVQDELEARLDSDAIKSISERDLNAIADSSAKRYSTFRGEATDKEGGAKLSPLLKQIQDGEI